MLLIFGSGRRLVVRRKVVFNGKVWGSGFEEFIVVGLFERLRCCEKW